MKKGQIVKSLSGHDGGSYYVVMEKEDGFAYIADGRRRKAENPKRKSLRHLLATDEAAPPDSLTNKKIRGILHKYNFGNTGKTKIIAEEE